MRGAPVLLLLLPAALSLQAPPPRPARGGRGGQHSGQIRQGPVFIQEPANKVDFSNSSGATVLCGAHGDPPPTLSWLLDDGSEAADIPGLRRLLRNGSLHFAPFSADEYRAEVHATAYRCRASSSVGTILSRRVRLRAVVHQNYEVQVYDEFVILGNTAVLHCHVPSFVREYVAVTGWVRGDDVRIQSHTDTDGRYSVFPTGELHIREARAEDGTSPYRCETRHRLTGETRLSAVAGRVVVAPPQSSVPPRVTDSRSVVSGRVRDTLELPCAAQGFPLPEYSWFRVDRSGQSGPVQLSAPRVRQLQGSLVLQQALLEDAGLYTCVVTNSVGTERVSTSVVINAPLAAYISPQVQTIDVDRTAFFNCTTEGHPQMSMSWLKDGRPLAPAAGIEFLPGQVLKLESVQRSDGGMYQCFVSNGQEAAQGSAHLRLGDAAPMLLGTFPNETLSPGAAWSARCEVWGAPTPQVAWTLDGGPLPPAARASVSNRAEGDKVIR